MGEAFPHIDNPELCLYIPRELCLRKSTSDGRRLFVEYYNERKNENDNFLLLFKSVYYDSTSSFFLTIIVGGGC